MSCPYRDLFGAPGTGPHSFRFLGTAIVDYTLAILLAMFITWKFGVPLELTTICVLIFGVLCHWVFCVDTATLKYLGL
jgi:hypothetical protein